MPCFCEIDRELGVVYTRIEGASDAEEILAALSAVVEDPAFRPGLRGIVDLRESRYTASTRDVNRIVSLLTHVRDRVAPSRSAIVVGRTVDYGMARVFQSLGEDTGIETRIFRTVEEGKDWVLS